MLEKIYKKHNSFFSFKSKNINQKQTAINRILELKKKKNRFVQFFY